MASERGGATNITAARKSKIPVLSKEYRSRLIDIREKRETIDAKEVELSVLKQKLSKLTLEQQRMRLATEPTSNVSATRNKTPPFSPLIPPEAKAGARRTTITTPKGTKRKGMMIVTRLKFAYFCVICIYALLCLSDTVERDAL